MSLRSLVSTVPPGSAKATMAASTAEPWPAWARRAPARRAVSSGRSSTMKQVLRNRFTVTSVRWRPDNDSTRTIEGTTGGQIPSCLNASTSATAFRPRSDRRLTAPESRTSRVMHLHQPFRRRGCGVRKLVLGPVPRPKARQPLLAESVDAPRLGRLLAAAWRRGTAAPSRFGTDHQEGTPASLACIYDIHTAADCQHPVSSASSSSLAQHRLGLPVVWAGGGSLLAVRARGMNGLAAC